MRGLLAGLLLLVLSGLRASAADPDALWKIVNSECVPDQVTNGKPAPCSVVDVWGGVQRGFVVLKDIVGASQYLLIATGRLGGMEAPELLAVNAPNFFAQAWDFRRFTVAAAKRDVARDELSLAINSIHGRTQNQLHIHINCLQPAVAAALRAHAGEVGERWAPFPVPLAGRRYQALALHHRAALWGVSPFRQLANGIPAAGADMGEWTIAVAGAHFSDGDGFILLADRADAAAGNTGSAEELQDHDCRPPAMQSSPGTDGSPSGDHIGR